MANNRMKLFHRPTGKCFPLGKRMGLGWYTPHFGADMDYLLDQFFDKCVEEGEAQGQDDFVLAMEHPPAGSAIAEYWLGDDGKPTLTKPEGR